MKRIRLLILMTAAGVLLAGCAGSAAAVPSPSPETGSAINTAQPSAAPDAQTSATPWVKDEGNDAQAEDAIKTTAEAKQQSKAMEHALEELTEVNDAEVVAIDRTALVGLKFTAQYQGGLDGRMKKAVLTQLQTVNKSINAVCVTADSIFAEKIDKLEDMLDSAADFSEIKQQFEALAKEITDSQ